MYTLLKKNVWKSGETPYLYHFKALFQLLVSSQGFDGKTNCYHSPYFSHKLYKRITFSPVPHRSTQTSRISFQWEGGGGITYSSKILMPVGPVTSTLSGSAASLLLYTHTGTPCKIWLYKLYHKFSYSQTKFVTWIFFHPLKIWGSGMFFLNYVCRQDWNRYYPPATLTELILLVKL